MTTLQSQATGRLRLTVEEFTRIQEAGLFDGRHIQLLEGELYEVTKSPPHNFTVAAVADALRSRLPKDLHSVREEKSIQPWANWWPEPDIVVARGPQRRFERRHPGPEDIALIVEVCDSSEQDYTRKRDGYARAGIPIYCIVDLTLRCVEVYRKPDSSGYLASERITEGQSIDLVIDGHVTNPIAVADLLPSPQST